MGPAAIVWRYYKGRNQKPKFDGEMWWQTTLNFINVTNVKVKCHVDTGSDAPKLGSVLKKPSDTIEGEKHSTTCTIAFPVRDKDGYPQSRPVVTLSFTTEGASDDRGEEFTFKLTFGYGSNYAEHVTDTWVAERDAYVRERDWRREHKYFNNHNDDSDSDANEPESKEQRPDLWYSDQAGPSFDKILLTSPNGRFLVTAMKPEEGMINVVLDLATPKEKFEARRVKCPTGAIYLGLDGLLRHIANASVYRALFGESWTVEDFARSHIERMPKGPSIDADPVLISPPGGGPIWLIDDGKKRWIKDPDTMNRYGFDWTRVVHNDGSQYPDGAAIGW